MVATTSRIHPDVSAFLDGGPKRLLIGGRWVEAASGRTFDTLNPATGEVLARVARGDGEDIDRAVAAARTAFEEGPWATMTASERGRIIYRVAELLEERAELFAQIETLDNGKPLTAARRDDVPLSVDHFRYYAGWPTKIEGRTVPVNMAAQFAYTLRQPVGVCGQIIPWNYPLMMAAWKLAPALAAGCAIVLKPAEQTPLSALLLGQLLLDAGVPEGVVNVVTGFGETAGAALSAHMGVDKIAFTGSTEVGRAIRRSTAGTGKRLSLELGGKSPFVVCEDADLDSVVEGVVDAIWFNQGQVCCAGSRLLVQEGVEASLLAKLRARMERLRVGDPLDKAIDIGAIVAPVQLQRIRDLVAQGEREGATIWQPSWACPTEGLFYPPTLVTDVAPASTLAQVEVFGPVLAAMTFRTKSEAVALANNTPYGLAASVWSENINTALDIARDIKAGTVWINCSNLFDAASGFGGYRESGFGREGGKEGLYEYLRPAWEVVPHPPTPSPTVRERPAPTSAEPGDQAERSAGAGGEGWPYPPIDRTPKLYVGGKQARPDSGYSRPVLAPDGRAVGEAGEGNRKDIRNAVEAARGATAWAVGTAHARAQVIYYIAENLAARADELAGRLSSMTGAHPEEGRGEVEASIERLFTYAAWADKYDGLVHATPLRGVTLAVNEPIGVIGIACDDRYPLLGLVALVAPAIAMGNTVVVVPSERYPLAATDLYQVLDTSDAPAGVVNIVTGPRDALARVLAEHDDVDAIWYAGLREGARAVEQASAGNLKRAWIVDRPPRDLMDPHQGQGQEFLREATQVKNMWVPSGD